MKKTRKAHLWIGLIASIFIFMESITGLLMNEPWLIGQTQMEGGRGDFEPGQFNQGQFNRGQFNQGQGVLPDSGQAAGQTQGSMGTNENGQFQGRPGFGGNGNLTGVRQGEGLAQGSITSIIRGLHEGRIGNTNVKWLIDLVAIAMIALTGTGIYLSIKVLRAEGIRKKRQAQAIEDIAN